MMIARLGKIAITALIGGLISSASFAAETVSFGYLDDPSAEAVVWALKHGKVTSDTVKIEVTALSIPALIQAVTARSYDVVETAAIAIPQARSRGLDIRIMGMALRSSPKIEETGGDIWVKSDSDIKSVQDLKGRSLAVYSLSSSGITMIRDALSKSEGMNVSERGGDLTFVEVPPPAMPAALATGRVDAATLIHSQIWEAKKTGAYRPIYNSEKVNNEKYGILVPSAVLAGYGEKLQAKPEVYAEFLRVLKASADYALAHPDEVFESVAKESGVERAYFDTWFRSYGEFPVNLDQGDLKALKLLWEAAQGLGILKAVPTVEETLWVGANVAAK
jgi:NitT/TauT family transport system substrate-binding protein